MAEFAGMTVFMIIGLGSVQGAKAIDEPGLFVISTGFGVGLAVGLYLSGGHLNPVVTLMLLVTKRVDALRAVLFVVSQMTASILASALVYSIVPGEMPGVTVPGEGYGAVDAFVIEVMATAILLAVVWEAAVHNNADPENAPKVIGAAVLALHLFLVPTSGASMNPARSFGPAVVGNVWTRHWIYIVGPVVGGILGSGVVDAARSLYAIRNDGTGV